MPAIRKFRIVGGLDLIIVNLVVNGLYYIIMSFYSNFDGWILYYYFIECFPIYFSCILL